MKKQTSPPNRRGRLVLLCFVLGLILIVMLVGTVYLQHLLGRIHYVDSGTAPTLSPEELDAYLATQPEEINTAPTMDPEDVTFPDYDADIGRDSDISRSLASASGTFCSSVRTAGRTRPGRVRIP